MRMSAGTIVLFAVLAACGGPDKSGEPDPMESSIPVEPDGGIGDGAVPLPELQARQIPARFHGKWDYVEGTCSTLSDLLIEIRADEIQFYESFGKVINLETVSESSIVVTLDMKGEGEQWQMVRKFELSNNGLTLTSSDPVEERYDPMPLKRCEDEKE